MDIEKRKNILEDTWESLKDFTQARIALGRTGVAIPLKETLSFRLAHAHARDAVYSILNLEKLHAGLSEMNLDFLDVNSSATNRDEYLKRPDLGRIINDSAAALLLAETTVPKDLCIVVSDGLSATAINENFLPLIQYIHELNNSLKYSWTPIVLVQQGRVAIADEIAEILKARVVLHLIGERPGLSSSNSIGAYITYQPRKGLTDESRNCISNIRPEGLPINIAAEKIMYMIHQSFQLALSGVQLKDTFPGKLLLD